MFVAIFVCLSFEKKLCNVDIFDEKSILVEMGKWCGRSPGSDRGFPPRNTRNARSERNEGESRDRHRMRVFSPGPVPLLAL